MSRSHKKHPFFKGHRSSWKSDRTRSSRDYRRFIKQMLAHENFDDIHDKHKMFHDKWSWTPDFCFDFFHLKNPKLSSFDQWKIHWEMRKGRDQDEVAAEILKEKKSDYDKWMRK